MKKLEDLVVIELASVLAGPSVGMFFAELGAQVIKVENKATNGDMTRSWKLPIEEKSKLTSAYFSSVNYLKEYHLLDFKTPDDLQKVKGLIAKADMVLTNFGPGTEAKFGLDNQSMIVLNPHLIIGRISGYGPKNPKPAFDVVLQAETGYISMTGSQDSPAKMPVALIDVLAAHQLKEGLLVALLQSEKRPMLVEVSLFDAAVAGLTNQASNYLVGQHVAQAIGTKHPNIAPYGDVFSSADQVNFVLAVGTEKHFKALVNALGDERLMKEVFNANQKRVDHREALVALLQEAFEKNDFKYWQSRLSALGIPYGKINTIQEVFEKEEAMALVKEEVIAGEHTSRVKGNVFTLSYLG